MRDLTQKKIQPHITCKKCELLFHSKDSRFIFLSLFYALGSIRDAYVAYIVTFTFLFT